MKKFISIFLAIILTCSVMLSVPSVSNAYHCISSDGKYEYTVIGDKKARFDGVDAIYWIRNRSDTLEIPQEIDGYTITSIGDYGDEEFVNPKRVILPNTVTKICDLAFNYYVDPEFNTPEESEKFISSSRLEEINIPSSVVYIGFGAFKNCTKLKNIKLSDNVIDIGKSAFKNCKSLKKVVIPGTIRTIREQTFFGCDSLEEVTIEHGVTEVRENAFLNCKSLEKFTYPSCTFEVGMGSGLGYYTENKKLKESKNLKIYVQEICNRRNLDSHITDLHNNGIRKYYIFNPLNTKKLEYIYAGNCLYLKISGKKAINWQSSNPEVAKVASNGKFTSLTKGTSTITATLNDGTTFSAKIRVNNNPSLSVKTLKMKKGQTKKVVIYSKAYSVNNVYKSTKKAKIIGSVKKDYFKVKALKKGETTLKITVNGKVLKLKVKVKAK